MKSIRQKAKAYDNAIEIAKKVHKYSSDLAEIERMEEIFPELRESEDEKIRKELLEYCKKQAKLYNQAGTRCSQIQSWIAWLKKLNVFAEHGDGLYNFVNSEFIYVGNPAYDNVSLLEEQGQKKYVDDLSQQEVMDIAVAKFFEQDERKSATIDIDRMVNDYANNKERGNEEFGKPVNCMIRAYRQGLIDALSALNLEKKLKVE